MVSAVSVSSERAVVSKDDAEVEGERGDAPVRVHLDVAASLSNAGIQRGEQASVAKLRERRNRRQQSVERGEERRGGKKGDERGKGKETNVPLSSPIMQPVPAPNH
jgi:hypothetical protein